MNEVLSLFRHVRTYLLVTAEDRRLQKLFGHRPVRVGNSNSRAVISGAVAGESRWLVGKNSPCFLPCSLLYSLFRVRERVGEVSGRCLSSPAWLGAIAALLLAVPALRGAPVAWETHKSKHFVVVHPGENALARKVAGEAEKQYVLIARALGYTRYGNFWLWDDRATIRIHPSHAAYVAATGAPAWSAGKANYARREVETFVGSSAFLERILPHELTHLVFRDFVGFEGEVPLWLDEGVAQWQEARATGLRVHQMARRTQRAGALLSVAQLTRIDVRRGAGAGHARLFYVQAASLVAFMIEKYGATGFSKLCSQLKSGKSLGDALRFTYPRTIRSIQALDNAWQQHLESVE